MGLHFKIPPTLIFPRCIVWMVFVIIRPNANNSVLSSHSPVVRSIQSNLFWCNGKAPDEVYPIKCKSVVRPLFNIYFELSIFIPNFQRRKLTLREVKTCAAGQISDRASTQIQVCLTTKPVYFSPHRDSGDSAKWYFEMFNCLSGEYMAAGIGSMWKHAEIIAQVCWFIVTHLFS